MSIDDLKDKIKPFYTLLLLIVVSSIFFAVGRLSVIEEKKTPIKIEYPNSSQTSSVIQAISTTTIEGKVSIQTGSGEVIGSKSGKKYYFPWCGTVKRIKPENQVHFESIEKAREAGFLPGGNCKGLK